MTAQMHNKTNRIAFENHTNPIANEQKPKTKAKAQTQ